MKNPFTEIIEKNLADRARRPAFHELKKMLAGFCSAVEQMITSNDRESDGSRRCWYSVYPDQSAIRFTVEIEKYDVRRQLAVIRTDDGGKTYRFSQVYGESRSRRCTTVTQVTEAMKDVLRDPSVFQLLGSFQKNVAMASDCRCS